MSALAVKVGACARPAATAAATSRTVTATTTGQRRTTPRSGPSGSGCGATGAGAIAAGPEALEVRRDDVLRGALMSAMAAEDTPRPRTPAGSHRISTRGRL